MRSTNSLSMRSDDKLFGVSFWSSINFFSYFVVVIMGSAVYGVSEVRLTRSYPMIFD